MISLSRRNFLQLTALGLTTLHITSYGQNARAEPRILNAYKSPSCRCCDSWVEHIRSAGFKVDVTEITDLRPLKNKMGVPAELRACHSAMIDGYVIEGHVPARELVRLLGERPKAIGLAVPGMPIGSPGMERGSRRDPFNVILFSPTRRSVFAEYPLVTNSASKE